MVSVSGRVNTTIDAYSHTQVWANRIMTGQLGTDLICLDVSSHLKASSSHYTSMDTHTYTNAPLDWMELSVKLVASPGHLGELVGVSV